jgi:hypothetical protein
VLESQKTHIAEMWEMERVLRHVAGKELMLFKNKRDDMLARCRGLIKQMHLIVL